MTTQHDPQDFICGDDWQLMGPLNDQNGNPLPLTGANIQWKLDLPDGSSNIFTLDNQTLGGVTIADLPSATIVVDLSAARTATITPGVYRDYLRVTLASGFKFTEWSGLIRAAPNPA